MNLSVAPSILEAIDQRADHVERRPHVPLPGHVGFQVGKDPRLRRRVARLEGDHLHHARPRIVQQHVQVREAVVAAGGESHRRRRSPTSPSTPSAGNVAIAIAIPALSRLNWRMSPIGSTNTIMFGGGSCGTAAVAQDRHELVVLGERAAAVLRGSRRRRVLRLRAASAVPSFSRPLSPLPPSSSSAFGVPMTQHLANQVRDRSRRRSCAPSRTGRPCDLDCRPRGRPSPPRPRSSRWSSRRHPP